MIGIQNDVLKKYIGSAEKIVIPDGVKKIGAFAFGHAEHEDDFCPNLKEVVLPESVTEIGKFAFCHCKSLVKIQLPENLKVIGREAFRKCSQLRNINLPDGLTEIPYGLFESCYSLSEIHIPDSVIKIQEKAFSCCGLKKIEIPPQVEMSPSVFDGYASIRSVSYQNISFEADRSLRSCIRLINTHDTDDCGWISEPEKAYIAFQLYCQYPEDKKLIRFLKQDFFHKFNKLIDRKETDLIYKILEYGILVDKENIDACLHYAIAVKASEIVLMLTDYKYHHLSYEEIESVISRKFAL
ncbi:MAG: leucine-rich repeat domain-containing protein [Oscillospiraceae bacterium]|nr:leucine-rich repeat domain-containing protein [Oscillospiraceae bacterium]